MIHITETAQTEHIVRCDQPGPRNSLGKRKLVATITHDGISVYCKTCQTSHVLKKADVIAAWERGESVQCRQHDVTGIEQP